MEIGYALTSINSVVYVNFDTFMVTNTWQYENNSEDENDRF